MKLQRQLQRLAIACAGLGAGASVAFAETVNGAPPPSYGAQPLPTLAASPDPKDPGAVVPPYPYSPPPPPDIIVNRGRTDKPNVHRNGPSRAPVQPAFNPNTTPGHARERNARP